MCLPTSFTTCTTPTQSHPVDSADLVGFVSQGGTTVMFCREHAADFDSALLSIGMDQLIEM